jgi:zinc and cadmium transporter
MILKVTTYAALIFLTAFIGGIIPLLSRKIKEEQLKLFVCVGAGLLLGMAFLHMIPEASILLPKTFGLWFLVGFLILLVLERFIMVHACEEHGCHYHTIGVAAFAGFTVHGIIEGFALASSLLVTEFGFLLLVAILAHKAPAGFALTSILKLSGKSNRQILFFVSGVALSGPLGLLLAFAVLQNQHFPSTAGILLSISAGTFLYIAACDLLPELHRNDSEKFKRLFAFLIGLALAFVSGYLLDPH